MINCSVIERIKEGDRDAFILIYNTYRSKVYSTAFFILKDCQYAEDVVQETFLQVYLKIYKLNAPEAFEAWLYKITVNYCFKLLKKDKKNNLLELDEKISINKPDRDELSVPDNIVIQNEMKDKIMHCIYGLPNKHRVVLTLFYFNNMSIKEIADIIDCSEGTIKSRLYYGKKILKNLLDSEYNSSFNNTVGGTIYESR